MLQLRNKTEAAGTFARFIERFHLKAQQKKKQIRRALRFQIRSLSYRYIERGNRSGSQVCDKKKRVTRICIENLYLQKKIKIIGSTIFTMYFFFVFKTELRSCAACGEPISDRFFLEVGGCSWHAHCLRCCMCMCPLDRQQSCFIRERQVYCKADYSK